MAKGEYVGVHMKDRRIGTIMMAARNQVPDGRGDGTNIIVETMMLLVAAAAHTAQMLGTSHEEATLLLTTMMEAAEKIEAEGHAEEKKGATVH